MAIMLHRRFTPPAPGLHQQVRESGELTIYARECRLANQIVRSEELRRRLEFLDYCLDQDIHDLWQAGRWAERYELCLRRLARDAEEIAALWQGIWRGVAGAFAAGREVPALDRFFFLAKAYLPRVLAGEVTFSQLEAGYDWERGCFHPDFMRSHEKPAQPFQRA